MKNKILTAVAVMASLCGYAQTKGTNTLGFGVEVSTNKIEIGNQNASTKNESKNSIFSLGYGLFVKDNSRVGLELLYGNASNDLSDQSGSKTKTYGGNVSYQQYYPLIKKLYAYAGGRLGYGYSESKYSDAKNYNGVIDNQYYAGLYGGITWFVSERFAFETSLLSANARYNTNTRKENPISGMPRHDYKSTNFSLNSKGLIDNLGFKIYLLF